MEAAPLYNDVAEGPDGGVAYWLRCEDGLRIRMALWEAKEASGKAETLQQVARVPRLMHDDCRPESGWVACWVGGWVVAG